MGKLAILLLQPTLDSTDVSSTAKLSKVLPRAMAPGNARFAVHKKARELW